MPNPIKYDRGYKVNFKHDGRQFRKRFPAHKHPDPKKAANNFINSIQAGAVPDDALLQDQINDYLHWAEITGQKRPSTIKSDRLRLNVFSEFTDAKSARHITIRHIRAFQEYFLENHPLYKNPNSRVLGNKLATWDRYVSAISAFLKWCKARFYVETNLLQETDEFKRSHQERLPHRIYTPGELKKIFKYFDDNAELSVFFRLLAYTGMRLNEARQLEWSAIQGNTIRIQGETKSGRVRSIPISSKLKPHLRKFKRKGRLFSHSSGMYYRKLQKALMACDLPPGNIKAVRHTFGTTLAKRNVHVALIQELMGHADVKTTMIYLNFNPSHLSQSISKLDY